MTVAIYARLSNEKRDNESIENQISICESYIKSDKTLCNADILYFKDNGYTGINLDRPALSNLLTAIRTRQIDVLVFKDLSRLGRNYLDVCKLTCNFLPFMKIRVISVSDEYDSQRENSNSNYEILLAFKNILNEFHCLDTSEKLRKTFRHKLLNGEIISNVPYGYIYKGKDTPEINEKEAKIVNEIFTLRLGGLSCPKIAGILNGRQVLSSKGGVWNSSKIGSMLKNRAYIGIKVAHERSWDLKTKKSRKSLDDELIVTPNIFPMIVGTKTFENVQRTFTKVRNCDNLPKHIMAYKLFCKTCGRTLGRSNQSFFCSATQKTGSNRCFKENIQKLLLYPAVLAEIKALIKEELDKHNFSFQYCKKDYNSEITRLKDKKAVLYEQYAHGKISAAEFGKQRDFINSEIEKCQHLLATAKQQSAWTAKNGRKETPLGMLKRLYNAVELTKEHMLFVDKILVTNNVAFEICLTSNNLLDVICRNISIYDEVL